MNEQNAQTKVEDATAAQLIAAIYTAKDDAEDYAGRRELNRAAGHVKLALVQETYEDGPAGATAGAGWNTLGNMSLYGLQELAKAHRLRAEAADNAGATRELRRAEAHIYSAMAHLSDDAWEGDKVAKPEPQTVQVEGIASDEAHGLEGPGLGSIDQELAEEQTLADGTVDGDA